MKVYHLTKHSDPMFMVSTYYSESLIDILTKYIPTEEIVQAISNSHEKCASDDNVNLLLCTETGCEFTLVEQEIPNHEVQRWIDRSNHEEEVDV